MKKRLKLLCEKAAHCLWTPADLTFRKLRLSGLPLMRIQLAGQGVGVFLQKATRFFLFCRREARFGIRRYTTAHLPQKANRAG